MLRAASLAALAVGALGHGYQIDPVPRAGGNMSSSIAGAASSCPRKLCFWFSQGCTIGCPKCTGTGDGSCGEDQGEATLPDYAVTYRWYGSANASTPGKVSYPLHEKSTSPGGCGTTPWCAPGSAPIEAPCGIAGGDIKPGGPGAGGIPPTGHQQGEDARGLPELPGKATVWEAGSIVNVSWAISANHGGGYQYRLCKKSGPVTEECFQGTPMEFYGDDQYIQYCINTQQLPPYNDAPEAWPPCDERTRVSIPAVRVNTGTVPKGSTWTRNPIPGCKAPNGGAYGERCGPNDGTSPDDYQFPPAAADLSRPGQLLGGFGVGGCYGDPYGAHCGQPPYGDSYKGLWWRSFHFNIVDRLVVPKVEPGEYIMSFRWDCEQTPQIWSTCTDITITDASEVVV